MSAITLIDTPEFAIKGEFLWFGVILHADVKVRYSKGVRNRFKKALSGVVKQLSGPCYAFHTSSHDPKKRKFIRDMGGVFDHYRITCDGERAEMYLFSPSLGPIQRR